MIFTPKFYLDEKQKRKYEALVPQYTKPILDNLIQGGIDIVLNTMLDKVSPARRGIPPPPPPPERWAPEDGNSHNNGMASDLRPTMQREYRDTREYR